MVFQVFAAYILCSSTEQGHAARSRTRSSRTDFERPSGTAVQLHSLLLHFRSQGHDAATGFHLCLYRHPVLSLSLSPSLPSLRLLNLGEVRHATSSMKSSLI